MPILKPVLPPYDIGEWQRKPFPERVKMVCQSWALQGYGTPWPIYIVYVLKVAFYVWMWTFFCAFAVGSPPLIAFLAFALLGLPLLGNLVPSRVSFLSSMRYYAGNWAYSVWLFKGDSSKKLDTHLTKAAPSLPDQLRNFLDDETIADAATGVRETGKIRVKDLLNLQPWPPMPVG